MTREVFIIGAARSGTKLCRDLLADHHDVGAIPFDINYLWMVGNESLTHDSLSGRLPEKARRLVAREIVSHRQRVVLEKTVSNCLRVEAVADAFPNAVFIFLIRDGYDVTESAMRQWLAPVDWQYTFRKAIRFPWLAAPGYAVRYARSMTKRSPSKTPPSWGPRYPGIDQDIESESLAIVCAKQWALCNQAVADGFTAAAVSPIVIRYEDFTSDPLSHVNRVYRALGLSEVASITREVRRGEVGKGLRTLDADVIAETTRIIEPATQMLEMWLRTVEAA